MHINEIKTTRKVFTRYRSKNLKSKTQEVIYIYIYILIKEQVSYVIKYSIKWLRFLF